MSLFRSQGQDLHIICKLSFFRKLSEKNEKLLFYANNMCCSHKIIEHLCEHVYFLQAYKVKNVNSSTVDLAILIMIKSPICDVVV